MPPTAGYSHIAKVKAKETIYISGQISMNEKGEIIGQGDLAAQTTQIFENIKAALTELELDFNDVIKLSFYLTDITQMAKVREVRDKYINLNEPPTSSAMEVSRFVHEDLLIEIEAIAAK
jgi:reactive intermediate/imine deaminase